MEERRAPEIDRKEREKTRKRKLPIDGDGDEDGDGSGGSSPIRPPRSLPSLENSLSFSDTLIALRMMGAQFPLIHKVVIQPFVLRSQLYSSVKDRTQVDRDLELLKLEKVIRIFKLSTGQDDHAVMFKEDYLSQMEFAIKGLHISNQSDLEIFEWFRAHVVECKLDVSIHHEELCSLLSIGGNVKDKHISMLINAGLLTRQLIDSNMYWFAIPNIGFVLKGLTQGRKELLSFLSRKKFKDMPLAPLEKKTIANVSFGYERLKEVLAVWKRKVDVHTVFRDLQANSENLNPYGITEIPGLYCSRKAYKYCPICATWWEDFYGFGPPRQDTKTFSLGPYGLHLYFLRRLNNSATYGVKFNAYLHLIIVLRVTTFLCYSAFGHAPET